MEIVITDGGRLKAGYKGKLKDCGIRAASLATGFSYQVVHDTLRDLMQIDECRPKRERGKPADPKKGVWRETMHKFLTSQGFTWHPTMGIGTGCKVHLCDSDIVDTGLVEGIVVLRLSKHFCTLINGALYDNHNPTRSGNRCIYGYWKKAA